MTSYLRNPRLDHAKRGRLRYRLQYEYVDEKICGRAKNRESRRRQRQSGLQQTELQDLQLGVVT